MLFKLLSFLGGAPIFAVITHQVRTESIERNNLVGIAFNDRRARHPADDASIFTLRDGHSAGGFDRAESFRSVIAHAGHQNSNGDEPKLLRDGMKKNVGGWAVSVYRRAIGENSQVT